MNGELPIEGSSPLSKKKKKITEIEYNQELEVQAIHDYQKGWQTALQKYLLEGPSPQCCQFYQSKVPLTI